jgi:uncharacterized protein YjbI with pentapeptide repeats
VNQEQQPRWRPTRRQVLWTVGIVVALAVLISIGYALPWTGFGQPEVKEGVKPSEGVKPYKTLWDWLELLIIPAVLAAGGLWFNQQQRQRELEIADRRAQDEALQAYLDQIGQLLLDKDNRLRDSQETDEVREVRVLARAQTLTVLDRLDDGRHKRSVVRFLYESGLIFRDRVAEDPTLKEADLSGVYLHRGHLRQADLRWANLRQADLREADLREADLTGAILSGADLSGADSGADLSGAIGVTAQQLGTCKSLADATMPNGQKYEDWLKDKKVINCLRVRDWDLPIDVKNLKYKEGRGEDEENSGS